jgi:hypothetical protein
MVLAKINELHGWMALVDGNVAPMYIMWMAYAC